MSDITEGCSVSLLSEIFNLDRKTVAKRLKGTKHDNVRAGHKIYKIPNVAHLLTERYLFADEEAEEEKLTPEKEKAYWEARLKQQQFEENEGDLWRTDKIVELLGSAFKSLKLSVNLFSDRVERESGLTEVQRSTIMQMSDDLLAEMYNNLVTEIDPDGAIRNTSADAAGNSGDTETA